MEPTATDRHWGNAKMREDAFSHYAGALETFNDQRYPATVLVFARPPWGLGAVFGLVLLWESMFPWVSVVDALRATLLCRAEDGRVEEWVVTGRPGVGLAPPSPAQFLGEVPRGSLRRGSFGILTVRAEWGTTRGRVPRRWLARWAAVAAP
jgi:hypothetical protein